MPPNTDPNPAWARPLISTLSGAFSPALLKKEFQGGSTPSAGHCYAASEALFHALGGKAAGFIPMNVKVEGVSHWFLKSSEGCVIDPTWDQFPQSAPYAEATGRGFLTRAPSVRARQMMDCAGWESGSLSGSAEPASESLISARASSRRLAPH